jgi:hypothetical protein
MKNRFWKIILHAGHTPAYSWHCVDIDGLTVEVSERFSRYGAAVRDAINHGFDPRQDPWTSTNDNYTTHYAPGKAPVIVPAGRSKPAPRLAKATEPRF